MREFGGRQFASGTAGQLHNHEIAAINPQAFFYNLWSCTAMDFSSDGFIGGEYVFGSDLGLLAVGSAKVGAMWNQTPYYYMALGEGETFGDAWHSWWTLVAEGGFSEDEIDWHYGMTMIGDPLLTTQIHRPDVPEPAALALLAAGAAAVRRRRTRTPT